MAVTVEPVQKNRAAKNGDHFLVKFSKPQLAIASGQSLVLYDGQICVGGGVIV